MRRLQEVGYPRCGQGRGAATREKLSLRLPVKQTKGIWRVLWPVSRKVRTGVDGDHDVHASCLDKLLSERHVLFIRTTVDELQPPGVQVFEVGFPREVIERLSLQ